jgi:NADH dehydrogenase FAD-containing subunit
MARPIRWRSKSGPGRAATLTIRSGATPATIQIHRAPDGAPWLWEIEHASRHPEHIAAALAELRQQTAAAA